MSWTSRPLAQIADFNLGKMLDQKKNRGQLLPYLANVNVRWGKFELNDLREMRFEDHEVDRFELRHGDIVMCEGGEPGRCAIWKEQVPGMMYQKALHRIRPHSCLDGRFLYYTFLKMGQINAFSGLFTGSTIKHLPKDKLAKLEIRFPPLAEQQHIATTLSAYDDLIENNRRRITLLEEAARQLYKEWFVRFRFPGHEHVKIIDGLPEGWKWKEIGEVADDVSYGYTASADPDVEGPKFLRITDIVKGQISWPDVPQCPITEHKAARFALSKGDVVAARTGATTGWARRIGRIRQPAVFASYLVRFRFGRSLNPVLAAIFMESESYKGMVWAGIGGAAQPNASAQLLAKPKLLVPTEDLQTSFASKVEPNFQMIDVLMEQVQNLSLARDLLLPKLMSGAITV